MEVGRLVLFPGGRAVQVVAVHQVVLVEREHQDKDLQVVLLLQQQEVAVVALVQ
jgi:hypothetical protein